MKRLICTLGVCLLTVQAHATNPSVDVTLSSREATAVRFKLTVEDTPVQIQLFSKPDDRTPLTSVELRPDKEGRQLGVVRASDKKSRPPSIVEKSLSFWPKAGTRAAKGIDGVEPRSWKGRELHGVARIDGEIVSIWVEGKLILQEKLAIAPNASVALQIKTKTGKVLFEETTKTPLSSQWSPIELSHLITPKTKGSIQVIAGVPFEIFDNAALSLKEAGWPEAKNDTGGFTEAYDADGYFLADRRIPMTQAPKADYIAAHLLAYAEDDPATSPAITIRVGRRLPGGGVESQVLVKDFPGTVPVKDASRKEPYFHVRIPFTEAFAQDLVDQNLDIELTKELRLARKTPDPNRFRWRPLGKPSGVVVAAMTLEKSPLQMRVTPLSPGGLVVLPEEAGFSVSLENITSEAIPFELELKIGDAIQRAKGTVPAKSTTNEKLVIGDLPLGHHSATITLKRDGKPLLTRWTAVGILPKDERKYRAEAPWGTWDNFGAHFTPKDPDLIGSLMHRLGLRFGMFAMPPEARKRYGVIKGNHFKYGKEKPGFDFVAAYEAAKQKDPDLLPEVLIFHEASISGGHATRIPDIFHDRPPYQLNEDEKVQFKNMWDVAYAGASQIRAKYPDLKFHLGNGPIPLREEFYRHKFPANLFDTGGNENPTFGRPPETQPPDPIGNNSSLWMDRQMLDAYGYKDKDVSQAHETIYPSTNPGNLSYRTQADYFVRHILHSMAWKMSKIRPGSIVDAGNSYYHSGWGGVGFLTQHPGIAPKPAALAIATLTRVLDGATYAGYLDLDSDSTYALRFKKRDGGEVIALWVVRGERDVTFSIKGTSKASIVAIEGQTDEAPIKEGRLLVTASASPQWIVLPEGAKIEATTLGKPNYPDSDPVGKVTQLDKLETLDGWEVETKANPTLEFYNPMTPRRLGKFAFEPAGEFEGRAGIKVQANPISHGKATMPMYQELVRTKPLLLPGKPTELGLWVNGNSAWGRIIFELEDASGQRWISIGAKAKGGSDWLADWLGKERAGNYTPGEIADWNTDDAWGLSRINFDGWRYLGIPLPGNYPGEGYPWPSVSQWKWDGDGKVHYPLTVKKLVVELPEKTLYLQRYEPARRPEIYLSNLVSVEGSQDEPKQAIGSYEEKVQTTIK